MAVAVPSTLPMKLWRAETRGKAAAAAGSSGDPVRILVTVTVLGSAGPLRFIVLEGDTVATLIRAALRCYAREGRMPLLGTDPAGFVLSTANGGSGALKEDEKITFNGCRSFLLWQKDAVQGAAKDAVHEALTATPSPGVKGSGGATPSPGRKGSGGWKAGLNKFLLSFSIKV